MSDLFGGRTFATLEEGMAYARDTGFATLGERGIAAADELRPDFTDASLPAYDAAATALVVDRVLLFLDRIPAHQR